MFAAADPCKPDLPLKGCRWWTFSPPVQQGRGRNQTWRRQLLKWDRKHFWASGILGRRRKRHLLLRCGCCLSIIIWQFCSFVADLRKETDSFLLIDWFWQKSVCVFLPEGLERRSKVLREASVRGLWQFRTNSRAELIRTGSFDQI